ncbi:MAG: glutamate racemase [Endomicrobium sp.]|jgi:glutamate racemase|nr:glutamate racemase [Endomicrobium sp.]
MIKSNRRVKNNDPIGIFDSGFGGLSIMSAIHTILPYENIIYFGDTMHSPYGSKSRNAIREYIIPIINFFIKCNVKLIVIACNTASATVSLPAIQNKIRIPIIGVILPGVKLALTSSCHRKIGIVCTESTLISQVYPKTINHFNKKLKIYQQCCPLLVPLIEEGFSNNTNVISTIAINYLEKLLYYDIDTLILGCTHYLLIKNIFASYIRNKNIKIIDSAKATAYETYNILYNMKLTNNIYNKNHGNILFFVSDNPNKFQTIGQKFFFQTINNVQQKNL